MKVWIVTIECNDGLISFVIDGIYSSEQKAKEAREQLYNENPEMDLCVDIIEKEVL